MLHGCVRCPFAVGRLVCEDQAPRLWLVSFEYVDREARAALWVVVLNPVMMNAYLYGADVDEFGCGELSHGVYSLQFELLGLGCKELARFA